ncbi:DUF4951 domain-containing protein [Streptomyces sp. NBC_00094]|uniref:DUF4951 domain-containing protein n=1 Tax=Streptomyces sp. NBC_00094 TaxID=2903620 RepID=UPI002255B684|nr:DUF4951 domain-containing protein [Streptomyces sp. NBC_00094]MCX5393266.1 hypothetical protein [Streptomyces sp. NBC_00094]
MALAEDIPAGFDLMEAAKVRTDQCRLNYVLRKGGTEMKAVARNGLAGTDEQLHAAASERYWEATPLALAHDKDWAYSLAKSDELTARSRVWGDELSFPTMWDVPGYQNDAPGYPGDDEDDIFSQTGFAGWIADQFWRSESEFYEDVTPRVSQETADAAAGVINARYSPDRYEDSKDLAAWGSMNFPSHLLPYADDVRLVFQYGGFPTSAPEPDSMEFRVDVENLKSRFASCTSHNPPDPHNVLGPEVATASLEWQQELAGQRTQRDTILAAEAQANKALQTATQAMGEALGQSMIASRLAEWRGYWTTKAPGSPDYPTAAEFAEIDKRIQYAQGRAGGRLYVASRAMVDANAQVAKVDTALAAAYTIADAAGLPRGRGLIYGQQAAQITKASAAAAKAATKATETALNATRASAADAKTLAALAMTQAHAAKADFRRKAAEEAEAQAKAAADGAAVQAKQAADNAAKAKEAQARAAAAEAEAKTAADDATAKREQAEAERDYAKSQKELADTERAKAATAKSKADAERQVAADKLAAAQSAASTAVTNKDEALAAEKRAAEARDNALAAEGRRAALDAKAYALEAQADADASSENAAASRAAATEARAAADAAGTAAVNARAAADAATTAASNARAAATRADAAAKRAQAAADGAKRDVAITEAAMKKATAAAADAIDAADKAKWNAITARALSAEAREKAAEAKGHAAVARQEATAAVAESVRAAGFAYATAQAAVAARDSAAQVIKPANDAIELGSPYKETDTSAGLAVLTGQASKTFAQQQAELAQAKSDQAAVAAAKAKDLAAQASADAKAAAEAAARAAEHAANATKSAAAAQSSANAAAASAEAAKKSQAKTEEYHSRAKTDAEAAQAAADSAGDYAAQADASATAAEQDASAARASATAAENDASTANDVATQAESDATTAEGAAVRAQESADEAQAAASRTQDNTYEEDRVKLSGEGGPLGAADVLGVPYGVSSTAESDGFCTGTNGCDYQVDYHVTGTMLFFVVLCPFPDTSLAECVGDLEVQYVDQAPIDVRETRTEHISGYDLTMAALEGMARGLVQDFVDCWNHEISGCLWAAAIVAPTVIGIAAKLIRTIRASVLAGSGAAEAVNAATTSGLSATAANGTVRSAKTAAAVKAELEAVVVIANAHGTTVGGLGKGVLWANKAENLGLMNAAHVAKVKGAGFTKAQIQTVFTYYDQVRKVTPQNPSAGFRADLMEYILKNW